MQQYVNEILNLRYITVNFWLILSVLHEFHEKFADFYKENQCKILYKTRSVLSWFCVDFSSFPDEFCLDLMKS